MGDDAFIYRVISFDCVKKEYTLEHVRTGEIKVISKEDYEYYVSEGKKKRKNIPGSKG
jgi:hypothetical protein